MNLTSKSRYALKVLMDLAYHSGEDLVNRSDIARRQGVPKEYLDQILIRLRRSGLVASVKGRSGGYRLARKADSISVWDIFVSVEDSIFPVACVGGDHSCLYDASCVSKDAWQLIVDDIKNRLEKYPLDQMVKNLARNHHMCAMGGIRECRPG